MKKGSQLFRSHSEYHNFFLLTPVLVGTVAYFMMSAHWQEVESPTRTGQTTVTGTILNIVAL